MGDINITGNVTGNVQSGDNNEALYIDNGPTAGPAEPSEEARQLLAAVEALREQLRAAEAASELHSADARIAEEALTEVEEAGQASEPEPGRVRRAVATLTGALASAAGLAQALEALRSAAAPWF
jgi:hypothetical protein